MRIDKDPRKEEQNRQKHKIGFSLAEHIFADPLSVEIYDRYENGEHRWHIVGAVGVSVFLVLVTYPDGDDEQWVRVIGLRHATPHERKKYEEGGQG